MPSMAARKDRTHQTGRSNRPPEVIGALSTGMPIDFDATARSAKPSKMSYKMDTHVPLAATMGIGNMDFEHKLAGQTWKHPRADMRESKMLHLETKKREMEATRLAKTMPPGGIGASQLIMDQERDEKQKGFKSAPRWNPKRWYEAPTETQAPLMKEEGETWNHMESQKAGGHIKGQDRMFRSVRRPEDVATPQSDAQNRHPLDHDKDEYYPGRGSIDAPNEEPGNDFQIRPAHLPDFYNPPPKNADSVMRMQRLREVIKQRYAGRPRLVGVFRGCCKTKPGFIFPKDLQTVFDQMGIKVAEHECSMLVEAVDKDIKGACSFEEFADLIYGPRVNVGGGPHEPQERHVRHVTKTLVDNLISNGQLLGKAFCELDPERRYEISKHQFANALGTAANHISNQAIDFLWASQFPGEENSNVEHHCIDWRSFMSQLAHFAQDNRAPTPCCVQGRKRQYDLLQRTAALTGGYLSDVDLNRPDQNASDSVAIVADEMVHRSVTLPHRVREVAMLTEPYTEKIRGKAQRVERAMPQRISKARMKELLKERKMIHQDELLAMLCDELADPKVQSSWPAQEPIYAAHMPGKVDVLTLGPDELADQAGDTMRSGMDFSASVGGNSALARQGPESAPASLKLVPADVESYIATQRVNRDHEVNVEAFIQHIYKPDDERKAIERVNDGMARHLRGHRPPRERPAHEEVPRHENYWQARYLMEAMGDAIAQVENSNGGKLKPSRMFKKLDIDNDGYLTLSDLRTACEKFKIPHTSADIHAVFSELDKKDAGSVHIGEFTRNYAVHDGNIMDNMQKPIKAVYHEGGVQNGGPIQDEMDARNEQLMQRHEQNQADQEAYFRRTDPGRSNSAPPSTAGGSQKSRLSQTSRISMMSGGGMSGTGQIAIYDSQVNQMTGQARVTDVIRSRYSQWKPTKSEIFTSPAKTRYGMSVYPDTRHITEASMPLSGSYMEDRERFKTTNNVHSMFAVPDQKNPHVEDTMKRHSRSEYKIERIRNRQRDFSERCWAANEAASQFDEMKVARKAMNVLNYERKCHMACA